MTFLLAAWSFLKSPVGRYVLAGLAVLAVILGFGAWNRSVQHGKDQIHERAAVAAVKANLDRCDANLGGVQKALDARNAQVDADRAEGDRRAKMLLDGLQQARKGRPGAEAKAKALLDHGPVGVDACARAEAAREAVLRSLP